MRGVWSDYLCWLFFWGQEFSWEGCGYFIMGRKTRLYDRRRATVGRSASRLTPCNVRLVWTFAVLTLPE